MFIKICGITSREDIQMVSRFQPDFLGVVCFEDSKRNVPLEKIPELFRKGTRNVKKIMVCVNPKFEFLAERAKYFDGFQLCGEESPAFCNEVKAKFPNHILWKAFRIKTKDDFTNITQYISPDAILLDAFSTKEYGGTGKTIDFSLLKDARSWINPHQDFWVAGGISSENVHDIIRISQCDGVDLSSSLEESAGKKSKEKIEKFFDTI